MTLAILAATLNTGGLLSLLLYVAILAVVIWAIYALLQWAGITIPRPIAIILTALVCIVVILWLFKFAGVVT
jgi:hypothetical protein